MVLLENDINEYIDDLKTVFDNETVQFEKLPARVQKVLVDMRFNLGGRGFRLFKKMIRAVKAADYKTAAMEMKDSRWYSQVGTRAGSLVKMMEGVE